MTDAVLQVEELVVEFSTEAGPLRAVDGVSFSVSAGETLGLVGESGCGKSVTALAVMGLLPDPPGRIAGGRIVFAGRELHAMDDRQMRRLRGRELSMIFQEPMTALNPVYTVGRQIADVYRRHRRLTRRQARAAAIDMLARVGISQPDRRVDEYPHELSGGMRQRAMIAMALCCHPRLLIADEPTTALDVTTQAQVLEQILNLKDELGMAVILITHDLGVIAETCDRAMVMYCGQLAEVAPVEDLFHAPRHPYTRGLVDAIPRIRADRQSRLPVIAGSVPDIADLPPGCRFAARCPRADDRCRREVPRLKAIGHGQVACFHPEPTGQD